MHHAAKIILAREILEAKLAVIRARKNYKEVLAWVRSVM